MSAPRVFGVTGWKNSGKTTLIVALIKEFAGRGLRVSTIKHAHHAFEIDVPGKDSHRHRLAGAAEVLIASHARWALLHEMDDAEPPPRLAALVSRLSPCDLVLVEGFKGDRHPKIEVARGDVDRLIADGDPSILAVAADRPADAGRHETLPIDDVRGIADFILRVLADG